MPRVPGLNGYLDCFRMMAGTWIGPFAIFLIAGVEGNSHSGHVSYL